MGLYASEGSSLACNHAQSADKVRARMRIWFRRAADQVLARLERPSCAECGRRDDAQGPTLFELVLHRLHCSRRLRTIKLIANRTLILLILSPGQL